jgi:hypothetical protein
MKLFLSWGDAVIYFTETSASRNEQGCTLYKEQYCISCSELYTSNSEQYYISWSEGCFHGVKNIFLFVVNSVVLELFFMGVNISTLRETYM